MKKYILPILTLLSFNTFADVTYGGLNPPQYEDIRYAKQLSSITCTTLALYHEARSESDISNMMIVGVILNRIADKAYPDEACDVVLDPRQFSFVGDRLSDKVQNLKQYTRLYKIVEYSMMNKEFVRGMVQGVNHYHTVSIRPFWSKSNKIKLKARVDNHLFYESNW